MKASNPTIVQLIKQMIDDVIEVKKPSDVTVGTVVSDDPLKIQIGKKLVIDEDFIIQTTTFASRDLSNGDTVILIRKWGGQKYLAVDTAD